MPVSETSEVEKAKQKISVGSWQKKQKGKRFSFFFSLSLLVFGTRAVKELRIKRKKMQVETCAMPSTRSRPFFVSANLSPTNDFNSTERILPTYRFLFEILTS